FEAALDDQELFDTLAREQSLRDLLRDPAAKAQLLTALDTPKSGWFTWWRPAAAVATMAAAAVLVAVRTKAPAPTHCAIVTSEPSSEIGPRMNEQSPLVSPTPGSQPKFNTVILDEPKKKAAAATRAPLEREKAQSLRMESAPPAPAIENKIGAGA